MLGLETHPRAARAIKVLGAAGLTIFVAIQFVPYGWSHSNPPVVADAPWPDVETEELARRSCYDCHSNETNWPVYSFVAPMSWLVRSDVDAGRDEINFSDWPEARDEVDDAIETLLEGEMPPGRYTAIHRGAALSDAEVAALVKALDQMAGG